MQVAKRIGVAKNARNQVSVETPVDATWMTAFALDLVGEPR
jgi:hypothetical protein